MRNADDSRTAGAGERADADSRRDDAAIAEPAEQTPKQPLAVIAPLGQPGQHESPDVAECEVCVAVTQSPATAVASAKTGAWKAIARMAIKAIAFRRRCVTAQL